MAQLRRIQLMRYLPADNHASARWLYRTILDYANEHGYYEGSAQQLRQLAYQCDFSEKIRRTIELNVNFITWLFEGESQMVGHHTQE